ncbi:lamin tail domain-containing protein, partial [Candidatus Sumerlaeota bacterium]|nr:lamin tail domain-containing protein [Candidatus Sumerlaeota bacterium]
MKTRTWLSAVVLLVACAGRTSAQGVTSLVITEFMANNSKTLADGDGRYSDWIEIYNPTTSNVSLSGCYLTDDAAALKKWMFPASAGITVPAKGFVVVFASGKATGATPYVDSRGYIHTSFKLAATGESVALVNTNGATVISAYWDYPYQGPDVSYGLGANAIIGYFTVPTPRAANGNAGNGWVSDTKFSVGRGFYSAPFTVTIATSTTGATIRYTLDGSTPSETNGTIYSGPISISKTTVLRAMAYKTGWLATNVDTQTYLFIANAISQPATKPTAAWPDPYRSAGGPGGGGRQAIDYAMDARVTGDSRYSALMDDALLAIPSISIVTPLANLFDSTTGIYMNPQNDGEDWERPASVELLFPDGRRGFQVDTGLRIRGGVSASKSNPKHSFRIIMRSDYGDSKLEYPLFGENGPDEFDKMDFRTAQNFSWNMSGAQYATWLDDPFSRDTMRDMGHLYTN